MIHTKSVNPALGLRALVAGVWFGAGLGRGSAGAVHTFGQPDFQVPARMREATTITVTATRLM